MRRWCRCGHCRGARAQSRRHTGGMPRPPSGHLPSPSVPGVSRLHLQSLAAVPVQVPAPVAHTVVAAPPVLRLLLRHHRQLACPPSSVKLPPPPPRLAPRLHLRHRLLARAQAPHPVALVVAAVRWRPSLGAELRPASPLPHPLPVQWRSAVRRESLPPRRGRRTAAAVRRRLQRRRPSRLLPLMTARTISTMRFCWLQWATMTWARRRLLRQRGWL